MRWVWWLLVGLGLFCGPWVAAQYESPFLGGMLAMGFVVWVGLTMLAVAYKTVRWLVGRAKAAPLTLTRDEKTALLQRRVDEQRRGAGEHGASGE